MRALKTAGLALLAAGLAGAALAQGAPEKAKMVLGVGGKPALYYLPLTIADRKGFFKEEGLEVEINDFAGGARALQALVGGSVDVVTGAYEHTVRMQAKGQEIRGVAELGRFPSIGVGATASAVAAIQRGEIDIISNTEPVISKLEQDGAVVPLIDTRTEAGTRALFGGPNPAATLYTWTEFIEKNPETVQRLVNAFLKSLKWLRSATPEEVADTVPPEYHLGDKALYVAALRKSLESYSRDGIVSPEGMKSVLDMLKTLDPEMQNANVDLAKTFDDRFVKKSPVK